MTFAKTTLKLIKGLLGFSLLLGLFAFSGLAIESKSETAKPAQTEQILSFSQRKSKSVSFLIFQASTWVSGLSSRCFSVSLIQVKNKVKTSFRRQLDALLLFENLSQTLIFNRSARIALASPFFTTRG